MNNFYDSQAEYYLLARAFKSFDNVNEICSDFETLDFYDEKNQLIFDAILKLYKLDQKISIETVSAGLGDLLYKAGSLNYLIELNDLPETFDYFYLKQTLKDKRKIRNILSFAQNLINESKKSFDFQRFTHNFASKSMDIAYDSKDKKILNFKEFNESKAVYNLAMEKLNAKEHGESTFDGIQTDYYDLDNCISGLGKSKFIVIGARTGMGKTSLIINLIRKMKKAIPLIFSLEMTAEELAIKLTLLEAEIPYKNFKNGNLEEFQVQSLYGVHKSLKNRQMIIDDQSGIRPYEILGRAKRAIAAQGVNVIFIDYLQLMNGNQKTYESNQVKIASISRELKTIAKTLNVPIVALAQLNRESEKRTDNRPRISDLRESGSIEADADQIILIHRPDYYDSNDTPGIVELIVAKNRFGNTAKIELVFNKNTERLESRAFN